jgi:hypothetical protein
VSAKKSQNETVERQGLANVLPLSSHMAEPDRLSPKSGLSGVAASAIGMGLAMQSGVANSLWASSTEDVDVEPTDDDFDPSQAPVTPDDVSGVDATAENVAAEAPVALTVDEAAESVGVEPEFSPSAAVAASGRTAGIANAGAAAEAMTEMLSQDDVEGDGTRLAGEEGPSQTIDFIGSDTEGLVGSVLDPVLGEDGLVDDLLDALLGEGGLLDGLLGDEGLVDDLLDGLIGEGGILDLEVLEGLLGEDGLLDGVVEIILGEDGLLSDLIGEDGLLGDLLDPLLGDGGLLDGVLDPILGTGVVDDLIGEDGIVSGVVDDLLGDGGLVDEIVGDIPVVGDLVGSDGILGDVLGSDGLLGGLLGLGGTNAETLDESSTVPDEGYIESLMDFEAPLGEVSDTVSELIEGLSSGTVDDLMSNLLGDTDVLGFDVAQGDVGGFDDLFAGLASEDSLTGSFVEQGLLGAVASGVANDDVDSLLSEILGPPSSDILAGGDAFDVLLEGAGQDSLGDFSDIGGILGDSDGIIAGIADIVQSDTSLLDGLSFDQDDQV